MDSSPGAAPVHKKKDFKFQVPYNWQSNMAEGDMQWVGPEITSKACAELIMTLQDVMK